MAPRKPQNEPQDQAPQDETTLTEGAAPSAAEAEEKRLLDEIAEEDRQTAEAFKLKEAEEAAAREAEEKRLADLKAEEETKRTVQTPAPTAKPAGPKGPAKITLCESLEAEGAGQLMKKFQKGADALGLGVATVEAFAVTETGISIVYHDEVLGMCKTFVEG